jgi:hypothetical protein
MLLATPVPHDSLLSDYALRGAYTDCYAITVPFAVSLPQYVEAFYTTRLFKLERWLLATLLNLASTDSQARELGEGERAVFAAWKVEGRRDNEMLLDAGRTRSWLSVVRVDSPKPETSLRFGSAVLPQQNRKKFGLAFHALLGFHRLYSKLLLSAAARKLARQLD